jgi:hypothetical protein
MSIYTLSVVGALALKHQLQTCQKSKVGAVSAAKLINPEMQGAGKLDL